MTVFGRVARHLYELPATLDGSTEASTEVMRDAFSGDVDRLLAFYEDGTGLVAVQGPVSSMKTWQLTATAEALVERGRQPAVLAPQRGNRRDLVDRFDEFDLPYVEHPGRRDLCVWDAWKETVGRVDERICSNNGCPFYPEGLDLERVAADSLSRHRLTEGDTLRLDEETVKILANQSTERVCPFYLHRALVDRIRDEEAIPITTYAKAFNAADASDWLSADVVLMDESHTVAADVSRTVIQVDLQSITETLTAVHKELADSAEKRAREAADDLEPVKKAVQDWETASRMAPVSPEKLFSEKPITLRDAFEALDDVGKAILSRLRREVRSGQSDRADRLNKLDGQLRDAVEFFSRVQSFREGDLDFIHTRYEAGGEEINQTEFRRVADREAASTPGEVYEAWSEQGTHPAIEDRWGGFLDHHIDEVWSGRSVMPGGERDFPGSPLPVLKELESITNADTFIGYSATHNEVSDPARTAGEPRRTAHRVIAAPLQLRSDGDERPDYNGKTAVDPETPWFRDLVHRAKNETNASLAAVPINASNKAKWRKMPVETLELADGSGGTGYQSGLVPNSRGAIGEKDLESLEIDSVLCGIQVQGPAETARRLVELWELLAPDHEDPTAVLEKGWRLLAQLTVSGTIQAGGRFHTDATNIVFERPELLELAGFEWEPLTPSMDGFAGAFAEKFECLRDGFEHRRDATRAAKVVRYLEETPSKAPTRSQFLSTFQEVYDATDREATLAFGAAAEEGKVEYVAGRLRTPVGEAGPGPSG